MEKSEIIAILRRELETVVAERRVAKANPAMNAARTALRQFQSQRMARTHADLLAEKETGPAARFFLSDLYGPYDLTERDANLERIIPTMERLLPAAALETVAEAVALDALSEKLDAGMARRLGESFSEADYIDAYRQIGKRTDRERQLAHVESVGAALCELVRIPLVGSTLAMMRGPSRLAKLSELHSFLERGFKAFKGMKRPYDFVTTIIQRERAIMDAMYAGKKNPFATPVTVDHASIANA
ncbi:hypothetical protein [Noviherbaspirillum sp.]|jgi:hypothetical protein|uniref:FFLEELY motif protein n=1 Tax=Noviherbaspirillum sp. TaxID=1926288 RepID=UPI0025D3BE94|nr:hypothetical protein [Noviherbaspirillum sp.]